MKYPFITRRDFLQQASLGFGSLALSNLYGAPMITHHPPRAKSVIFPVHGMVGFSHVDSFDYKPMLAKHHGEDPRKVIGKIEATQFGNVGKGDEVPLGIQATRTMRGLDQRAVSHTWPNWPTSWQSFDR